MKEGAVWKNNFCKDGIERASDGAGKASLVFESFSWGWKDLGGG